MENKMKVEIWSDVMCPFCYIGKRNFETALEQFEYKKHIDVVWKSFLLDPSIPEIAEESYHDYLVTRKNMSPEQVKGMLENVTQSAKQVGLEYNFDKAVMVNSLNAHKLIQLAKTKALGNEAEERLFRAFFTEGKNIADKATLVQLGKDIGLDEAEINTIFSDEKYATLVNQDIQEAQRVGVQGVPFFVIDRKYGVSGAQPAQAFLENLKVAFAEWRKQNPETKLEVTQGQSCTTDGICE
ncbi:DsbA family oxidoreductase [Aequorivita viscosa]|uniref:Protein disulfide-isomerase n=1 Tax=Aequorivita viscosa TaxID=797419 RepID=A0A1M6BUS3_9FLAO|nr:DsbA family oxidoreductase [Aequorivita viscosa]SDW20437.1 protein disulfide-isomerase [Aequorivita viscosa]SHI52441.1 protein disulfide-isomerase [Aequorivita viscosa]